MKRMLLALFTAFWFGASAQITVSAFTFPATNDTLRYAFDDAPPTTLNASSAPGGPQIWNFSELEAVENDQVIYRPASAGMNFAKYPGADLVLIAGGGETYFNKTNTQFQVMGFAGDFALAFGASIVGRYQPALIERRAPMNFFDVNLQTSNLNFAFGTDQLPDSLFAGLNFIDSIRIRQNTSRTDVVDGWGVCQLPFGVQYDVLREKRTTYNTTAVDLYITFPFPGWIDLTTLLPGGGGFGDLIGTDTTVQYVFFSGTEKEEIAVVTFNAAVDSVQNVQFKFNGISATDDADAPGKASIQAHPNPAVDWVRFDCANLPADSYTFKIFNIIGNEVWKETHFLSGNRSVRVDIEDFKKGTYLYSLEDKHGNTISTKRLVIIKP